MAVFPQGMTNVDRRCNAGERRVLNQLKRCLTDDFLVWHDVPIGLRARQPDFAIVSPRWGLLVLEVPKGFFPHGLRFSPQYTRVLATRQQNVPYMF